MIDGGFGDACGREDLVAFCKDKEMAERYVEEHSKPEVYARPYNELYHHMLEVRDLSDVMEITEENFKKSPFER